MRKAHRTLALFFSPFLICSALTGLLWAYAPYLYWKQPPKKEPLSIQASSIALYAKDGTTLHTITFPEADPRDVFVEEYSVVYKKRNIPTFHKWVMRLHRLEFFGTHKELTIFPGIGLLAMFFTGLFLFKHNLK